MFQVEVYTFTDPAIVDALSGNDYAMSETTHENEQVAGETATAVAEGGAAYRERFRTNPLNRERYVVSCWAVSCGGGSALVSRQRVTLAELRWKAVG